MKQLQVLVVLAGLVVPAYGQHASSNSSDLDLLLDPSDMPVPVGRHDRTPTKTANDAPEDDEPVTEVTVDDVRYVYKGLTRNGANVIVTVVATSKKGDHTAPHGRMTLVDGDGEKYVGSLVGPGRVQLREDVPVKLAWSFGPSGFSGKSSAPSAKIKQFTLVSIASRISGAGNTIDFRNVPATVAPAKDK